MFEFSEMAKPLLKRINNNKRMLEIMNLAIKEVSDPYEDFVITLPFEVEQIGIYKEVKNYLSNGEPKTSSDVLEFIGTFEEFK